MEDKCANEGRLRQTAIGRFQPIKVTSVEILNNFTDDDTNCRKKERVVYKTRKLFSPNRVITRNRQINKNDTTDKKHKFVFPGICNLKNSDIFERIKNVKNNNFLMKNIVSKKQADQMFKFSFKMSELQTTKHSKHFIRKTSLQKLPKMNVLYQRGLKPSQTQKILKTHRYSPPNFKLKQTQNILKNDVPLFPREQTWLDSSPIKLNSKHQLSLEPNNLNKEGN